MKRVLLALCLLAIPARADAPADMAATANGFYKIYGSVPRIGGIPNEKARGLYAPVLSPRLNALLANAAAAEARYTKKFKAVPPLFEGDLFTSLFEGASRWTVTGCSGDAKAGRCTVQLIYNDPKKPVSWNDTLLMVNTPGGWRIDDVAYGAGFDFGNSGTLTQTMRMVLAQAQP